MPSLTRREKEVYNAKGVQGKRRRLLPCELAVSSVVLVSPEWLCSKQQSAAALFSVRPQTLTLTLALLLCEA